MRERAEYYNPKENNFTEEKLNGNGSIEKIILDELGFSSLGDAIYTKKRSAVSSSQIPLFAAKDIVLVDCLETNISNKLKLLGYRFWHNQSDYELGNYDLVKRLLPEGLIRIDDSRDDVLSSDELIDFYEYIEKIENITNQVIRTGPKYLERFKSGIYVISRLDKYGINQENIIDLNDRINKYTYKINSKSYKPYEDEDLNEIEMLASMGFYAKEISGMTGLSKEMIYRYLSALYYDERLKPQPERIKRNIRFKNFVKEVEKIRNEDEDLTDLEIANLLGASRDRVISATRILITLGRIKPKSMSKSLRNAHKTDEKVEVIRNGLRQMLADPSINVITMQDVNRYCGINIPKGSLLRYYNEIKREEDVPPLKYKFK